MRFELSTKLKDRLRHAKKVAVLTGAGVSAESGVPTFRSKDGLWKNFRPEELATPEAFQRNPKLVWQWYDWRRGKLALAEPNAAHVTLAEWEERFPDFNLITQNVDGLHDRAGSKRVIKLHGDLWWLRCTGCGKEERNDRVPLAEMPPRCGCGHFFRPGVVWFGEAIPAEAWERALDAAAGSELFFSIGTSALVQPAASLPLIAKRSSAYVVEINLERTGLSDWVDEVILGLAAKALPRITKIAVEETRSVG